MALSDEAIEKNVLEQFKYDPRISPSEIGVTVKDSVVTLLGTAERKVRDIIGVRGVINQSRNQAQDQAG